MNIKKLMREVLLFTVLALFVLISLAGEVTAGDRKKRPTIKPVPPKETVEKGVPKTPVKYDKKVVGEKGQVAPQKPGGNAFPGHVWKGGGEDSPTADDIKDEKQKQKGAIIEPVMTR